MAKSKDINDPEAISAHIHKLDPQLAALAQHVREIILDTDSSIGEQIKWNSPAFFYMGEMLPFDPKEYKRDLAVMHLRKGMVLLVLPTGASIPDTTGILEGNYTDGRRTVSFTTSEEIIEKTAQLQEVIKLWLALVK